MKTDLVWKVDYIKCNGGYELLKTQAIQTELKGRSYDGKFITLYKSGLLKVKKGFWWDGDSNVQDVVLLASCIHDALYRLIEIGVLRRWWDRRKADKLYCKLNIAGGMSKARAIGLRYLGVRLFGWLFV